MFLTASVLALGGYGHSIEGEEFASTRGDTIQRKPNFRQPPATKASGQARVPLRHADDSGICGASQEAPTRRLQRGRKFASEVGGHGIKLRVTSAP